jgi:hypothetical protein
VSGRAQWLNYPAPGTPRTRDGKPNLAAPAPRTSYGKPDLSGIWQAEGAPIEELAKLLPGGVNGLGEEAPSKHFLNILSDFQPEQAPIRPEAAALFRKHLQAFGKDSPGTHCLPAGVPLAALLPAPYKFLQMPGMIVMLYEAETSFRQIYTDGRNHTADPQPSWMGYSVGKWEGDRLVVDAVGFNDRSWLDATGHQHSDAMRITERYHRRDFGHMEVQITVDDPKTFTRPFTIKFNQALLPDTDLIESFCSEDEKDVGHLVAR